MAKVHVPAWKKLGLKLKYAKEDAIEPPSIPKTANGSRKTRYDDTNGTPEASTSTNGSKPRTNGEDPPSKKQKRVSFSSDTKVVDGDTARSALPSEITDAQASEKQSKAQQVKKSKPPSQPSKHKSQDALDYLHQYYYEHDIWKFSKNRETWILKHALSTDAISSNYNLPLAQYIYGLKSQGARKRLHRETEAAMNSASETGDGPKKEPLSYQQQVEFNDAMTEFPTQFSEEDSVLSKRVEAMTRSELLVAALEPKRNMCENASRTVANEDEDDVTKGPNNNGLSAKDKVVVKRNSVATQKKKKNRTVVVEYSSSSSDSGSESENDSEEDTSSPSEAVLEDDETSSSGSGSESDSSSKYGSELDNST